MREAQDASLNNALHFRGRRRAAYPLCYGISLSVPVVQALLGPCDGPLLAAAVSRAGALGTLTVRTPEPRMLARSLARIRQTTKRPVLLAFNAEWEREAVLYTALESGFQHFQLSWWNGSRLARRIHDAGGVVFWQVGTPDQAQEAIDNGADVLVAQGTDAGGQVRSPYSWRTLVAEILALPGEMPPIVAGGGLADRNDVADALASGAAAALLGTRFLLSDESAASRADKLRLSNAATADLTLDPALVGDWPCAPRRRLILPSGADRASLFAGNGLDRIITLSSAADIVKALSPKKPKVVTGNQRLSGYNEAVTTL